MSSAPPELGNHAVTGIAGDGNTGTVRASHDPFTNAKVAIRVRTAAFRSARKAFLNEAHAAGSRGHPNDFTVLDGSEQDGPPSIAMEHIDRALIERDGVVFQCSFGHWVER